MRWLKKPERPEGMTRRVIKFAWMPVLIDEFYVWLERYTETHTWTREYDGYSYVKGWVLKWRHLGAIRGYSRK